MGSVSVQRLPASLRTKGRVLPGIVPVKTRRGEKKLNAPSHTLSDAAAINDAADTLRASSIAKPQKAFAVAFAVLAAALAGCASGLGATSYGQASAGRVSYVDEGTVVGQTIGKSGSSQQDFAYTIRLPSGELVSVAQAGDYAIPAGTPVLIEYGAHARVIPQQGR